MTTKCCILRASAGLAPNLPRRHLVAFPGLPRSPVATNCRPGPQVRQFALPTELAGIRESGLRRFIPRTDRGRRTKADGTGRETGLPGIPEEASWAGGQLSTSGQLASPLAILPGMSRDQVSRTPRL